MLNHISKLNISETIRYFHITTYDIIQGHVTRSRGVTLKNFFRRTKRMRAGDYITSWYVMVTSYLCSEQNIGTCGSIFKRQCGECDKTAFPYHLRVQIQDGGRERDSQISKRHWGKDTNSYGSVQVKVFGFY